jgi:uncharacterized CHY-type Zn-finger protein
LSAKTIEKGEAINSRRLNESFSVRHHAKESDFFAWRLQRSEQYFTCCQSRSHFLRHANERWQIGQVFSGKCGFL